MVFSIIIPIYNSEKYLSEAIDSLTSQTFSFQENVEIILVNDGSTDKSEQICKRYKKKYPRNIKYIYIENSGPSTARNEGLNLVSQNSSYITFLDSDDKLEANTLETVNQFFKENHEVNLATIPVYYFEKEKGQNKLNNRFLQGSRVINIFNEYYSPQYYIGGVFIKNDYYKKSKVSFNENLLFWEDALFVNEIILAEGKYGVIADAAYWYRKRNDTTSLVDLSWFSKYRYTDLLKNGYTHMINRSLDLYGNIIPYVQYMLVYHMKLFLFQKNSKILMEILTTEEKEDFVTAFKQILRFVSDSYILNQNMRTYHKEFLLKLKYGRDYRLDDSLNPPTHSIRITQKKIRHGKLMLKGYFHSDSYSMKKEDKVFIKTPSKKIIYAAAINPEKQIDIWGYVIKDYEHAGFDIRIPIWNWRFQFGIETDQNTILIQNINLFSELWRKIKKMIY